MIAFDSDTYQVAYAGESIALLPKEFALLRYLYENEGRSFTREQLLDAVWPLEAPIDRTVDDHIYRIRKRIARWSHLLTIETVRGQGYKLKKPDRARTASPLLGDEAFAEDVSRMLSKYHGMGMGAALQLLTANKETLGLPGDSYYDVYIHFVRGDFGWLLETSLMEDWEKTAYAAFIHATVQSSPSNSVPYFEKLVARSKEQPMPAHWLFDLRLGLIALYQESGMRERAREEIEAIRPEMATLQSPSFMAIYLLREMQSFLLEGSRDKAEAKLKECEELLERHPIQRERGAFLVAKAILLYDQGEIPAARRTLDEGIETLKHTHFIPHLIANVSAVLRYLEKKACDESYQAQYERLWHQLAEQYGFEKLRKAAERWLDRHL